MLAARLNVAGLARVDLDGPRLVADVLDLIDLICVGASSQISPLSGRYRARGGQGVLPTARGLPSVPTR
jgi:hypothetical protein